MTRKRQPSAFKASVGFASHESPEASLGAAGSEGSQLGILASEILPSLPRQIDALFALASVMALPQGRWTTISTAHCGPRAPWRHVVEHGGLVQSVGRSDFMFIHGAGSLKGWEATLLQPHEDGGVTEHILVHHASGRPVRFGSRDIAERELQPIVDAGGGPPGNWKWSPQIDGEPDSWRASRPDARWRGFRRINRPGTGGGRWTVVSDDTVVYVARNARIIDDSRGGFRDFHTIEDAKQYCTEADVA